MKKTGTLKSWFVLFMVCCGLLTLVSCHTLDSGTVPNDVVEGSNVIIEENRNVSYFDAIRLIGVFKLFLNKGPSQALRLEGEDNILPIIETRVEGDTLVIESNQPYKSQIGITVYVSIEKIRVLEIDGAGKIIGEEHMAVDDLHLESRGAGEIHLALTARTISSLIIGAGRIFLEGEANHHQVEINGAGNIEAADLQVNTYDITINGVGYCRIFVTDQLNAVISGAGIVYYRGSPGVINSEINGLGKLIEY